MSKTKRILSAIGVVTACALSMTACGGSGSAQPSGEQVTTVRVGSTPSLSGLGLRVAIADGDFTERGLTVEPVPNKSANSAVPALINGEVQFAQMDTVTFLQAKSKGLPVKIVAGMGQQATNGEPDTQSAASVVAKPNSGIGTPKDLVGKRVGVPAIKTQTWMNIRAQVDADGGDSNKVEYVEIPPAQMLDLLSQGTVDAVTPTEPAASAAIASGNVALVTNTDAPGNKGVATSVYAASEKFIAENPDTVRKFTDALHAAATDVNANRELATRVAQEQLDYKPEQLQNAFFQPSFSEPIKAENITKVADLAVKYEILTEKLPSAEEMIWQQN